MIYDQSELKLVTKLLLQVSVRERYNSLVSDPNDGGMKDARDEDGKIIISDSTLRSLLPPLPPSFGQKKQKEKGIQK